jgi:site-specific DNA-methyltransferase (cytosine-N4-specific)
MNEFRDYNKVVMVATADLKENLTTATLYTVPSNYDDIKRNIAELGLLNPLLVTRDLRIISGNLRFRIALELKQETVPVVFLDVDEKQMDMISVSTNQFREKTNLEILREIEFYEQYYSVGKGRRTDLSPQAAQVKEEKDQAIEKIGRYKVNTLKSINKKCVELYGEGNTKVEELLSSVETGKSSLNKVNEQLERESNKRMNKKNVPSFYEFHTDNVDIYNKSCIDLSELGDGSVQTVVTSPPYFDMRDYGIGKDQLGHQDTAKAFIDELVPYFDEVNRVLKHNGSLFVNINDKIEDGQYQMVPEMFLIEMVKRGWRYVDKYLWLKPNPQYTPNRGSVRNFEPIFHFVKSEDYYFDSDWIKQLEYKKDGIIYGSCTGNSPKLFSGLDFSSNTLKHKVGDTRELRKKCKEYGFHLEHSATFPLSLPSIFILSTSKPGDTVLDIFSGTATTGEVALLTDRRYVGYELNPQFVMASEVRLSEHLNFKEAA